MPLGEELLLITIILVQSLITPSLTTTYFVLTKTINDILLVKGCGGWGLVVGGGEVIN